jgi:hypothetical protein
MFISPRSVRSASSTARDVASPAAHDLREPAFGAWRYVRSAPPSAQACVRAVEGIFQRQHALDLVRLDHRAQHVADRQRLRAAGKIASRQVVGHGEDAAEIVGRVAPFGREPGVVEVQPADHAADVEGRRHRVELVARARHARAALHVRAG